MNKADAQPARSDFERDAGAALNELRKTMGEELARTIAAEDRARADKTYGQVLHEADTLEDRFARDEPEPTLAERSPETEKRSFWQRLFARKDAGNEPERERIESGSSRVEAPSPEAPLRASYAAEKRPEIQKPASDEKERPSFNLFMRLIGAVLDAYTRAVDRYILDRAKTEDDKRRQWREHVHDRKRQSAQAREERQTAMPKPAPERPFDQQQRRPAKATSEAERPLASDHSQADDRDRSLQKPDQAPPKPPVTKPAPPKRSWEELTALVERPPPQRDQQGPKR